MPSLILQGVRLNIRRESKRLLLSRSEESGGSRDLSVPLNDVDRVVIVGHPYIPVSVLQTLLREGIPAFFITEQGRWLGSLNPDRNLNAARRLLQYQRHGQPAWRLAAACALVETKIRNSRRVLQRLAANRRQSGEFDQTHTVNALEQFATKARHAGSLDELRGIEGSAAFKYFQRLGVFFPGEIPFNGRSRRPPRDAANALLSWTYTILLGEIESALRAHGLDPAFGFLHELAGGTPSLALDLLEPLRAPFCDLLALNILNHGILKADDFQVSAEDGGTYLREEARRKFFTAYETAMQRRFALEKGGEHYDFRRVIQEQVWQTLRLLEETPNETPRFFRMP